MQHQFGVFCWREDGLYKKEWAVKTYMREYNAITYAWQHPELNLVVKRLGLLGR